MRIIMAKIWQQRKKVQLSQLAQLVQFSLVQFSRQLIYIKRQYYSFVSPYIVNPRILLSDRELKSRYKLRSTVKLSIVLFSFNDFALIITSLFFIFFISNPKFFLPYLVFQLVSTYKVHFFRAITAKYQFIIDNQLVHVTTKARPGVYP